MLHVRYNTEKIRNAYKSKYNLKRENEVVLLMITDSKEWYYLAAKICLHYLGGNIKTRWVFLLFKLSSFIENRKS